jgi:tetratricopeptide (TPR) repeat protein
LVEGDGQREVRDAPRSADAGPLSRLLVELAQAPHEEPDAPGLPEPGPGDRIGRFEIQTELGRGGFGIVYEAVDPELGRRVALKILRHRRGRGAPDEEALHREAEAVAQLHHPGIVTLHDLGTSPHGPYLVFERLEGEPLSERLARGPLGWEQALRLGVNVARAVAHAHARGVLHRDLKPANVFLCADGQVKVLDLGLSHLFHLGSPGGGTPGHMAPEQWRGEGEDPRTDVFALGVLLFQCVTGDLPFSAGTGAGSVLEPGEAPPLPAGVRSRRLRELVAECLAKDPGRRPATAGAVLERLLAIERSVEEHRRRRTTLRRAGAALLLVAVACAAYLGHRWNERRGMPPEGPVSVMVADFQNTTADADLDALSGMLATSLEQSRRLRVVTRARLVDGLRQAGRTGAERVDEALGRELGRRMGIQALVVPTVQRLGEIYSVDLKVLDTEADRYVFAAREQAPAKEGIPDLLDRLSDRLRVALRERTEDVAATRVRLGEAVTSRLDAYDHFHRGGRLAAAEKPTEALREYERAVELDPGFAQAHLAAASLLWTIDPERSRKALGEALRHADHLPERERLLVQAGEAALQLRTDEALSLFGKVRERWPEDPDAHWLAAAVLVNQRSDFVAAQPLIERAVALDPSRGEAEVRLQVFARRLDAALDAARRQVERRPGPESLGLLVAVHSARGEVEAALDAARRAIQAGASPSLQVLHALIRGGAFAEAEALVMGRMGEETPLLERRDAYINMAVLQAVQGRVGEARRTLDSAGRDVDGGTPSPYLSWARAFLLGGTGDADAVYASARAQVRGGFGGQACNAVLLADMGQARRAEELTAGYAATPCAAIVRAVSTFRSGRRQESLDALRALRFPMTYYYLGKLLLEERRDVEGLDALRAFQREMVRWLPFFAWAYPESMYLAAEALERTGDLPGARREVGRLLELWAGADGDLPLLSRARALDARLAAAGPRQ